MSRYLLRLTLALMAGLLAACSSFDGHWKEAAEGKNGATRWDGRWASGTRKEADGSAHGGRLRCVLESPAPVKSAKNGPLPPKVSPRLNAHFHANWLIFSGNYEMVLEPVPGKPHAYSGTHDLPSTFGGTYRYAATITEDHFTACYTSNYDRGTFDLHRLPTGKK